MVKTDYVVLLVCILGFLLFLYGAKTYNSAIGYAGIYTFIGSIAAYLINYLYKELLRPKI
jgi:membrane-bound ClpP family serine protease